MNRGTECKLSTDVLKDKNIITFSSPSSLKSIKLPNTPDTLTRLLGVLPLFWVRAKNILHRTVADPNHSWTGDDRLILTLILRITANQQPGN